MTRTDFETSSPTCDDRLTPQQRREVMWARLMYWLSYVEQVFVFACDQVDDPEASQNLIDTVTFLMRYGTQPWSEIYALSRFQLARFVRSLSRHIKNESSSSGSEDD